MFQSDNPFAEHERYIEELERELSRLTFENKMLRSALDALRDL